MGDETLLIVNPDPPEWQLETLSMMGYGEDHVLIGPKRSIRVKHLLVSTFRSVNSKEMDIDPRARR